MASCCNSAVLLVIIGGGNSADIGWDAAERSARAANRDEITRESYSCRITFVFIIYYFSLLIIVK
jgi:hypothetical protein